MFGYNWSTQGTPAELNEDIGNGFEFAGPGLYLQGAEFSLIVPCRYEGNPWSNTAYNKDTVFVLYHWNMPFQHSILSQLGDMPTRRDER